MIDEKQQIYQPDLYIDKDFITEKIMMVNATYIKRK